MKTECSEDRFSCKPLGRRGVVARFDGGDITSDGGAILLRELEAKTGIIRRFAACFTDHRDADRIEHTVGELVAQRVYGLALGYEDLNDHDELRLDPMLAVLVGKTDPKGATRLRDRDRGKALAGKSTLNRLELTRPDATSETRYKKIVLDDGRAADFFVDAFVTSQTRPPSEIILDLDATDDALHGKQEGRFFHGYYMNYWRLLVVSLTQATASLNSSTEGAVGLLRSRWAMVESTHALHLRTRSARTFAFCASLSGQRCAPVWSARFCHCFGSSLRTKSCASAYMVPCHSRVKHLWFLATYRISVTTEFVRRSVSTRRRRRVNTESK